MVQVGSQKYMRISFSFHILLITKFGYMSWWSIATSATSQNWGGGGRNTTADHDPLSLLPYVERKQISVQFEAIFFFFPIFWFHKGSECLLKQHSFTPKKALFFSKCYSSLSENRKTLPQIADLEWVGLS
jgi:hypothetical protein